MEKINKVLVPREEIASFVERLGKQITADYQGEEIVVIGILKGATVFLADLIRKIDCPIILDFMQVSSYFNGTESSGNVRIRKDLDHDNKIKLHHSSIFCFQYIHQLFFWNTSPKML